MRLTYVLLFLSSVLQGQSRPKSDFKLIQTQNGKNYLVDFEEEDIKNTTHNAKSKIQFEIISPSKKNPINSKVKEHGEDYQLLAGLIAGIGGIIEAVGGLGGAAAVVDGVAEVGAAATLGAAADAGAVGAGAAEIGGAGFGGAAADIGGAAGGFETGLDAAAETGLNAAEDPMVQGAWDPALQTNSEPFSPSNSPGRPTGRFVGDEPEPPAPRFRPRQRNPAGNRPQAGRPIRGRQSPGIKPLWNVPRK
jgi:hypothetical protein